MFAYFIASSEEFQELFGTLHVALHRQPERVYVQDERRPGCTVVVLREPGDRMVRRGLDTRLEWTWSTRGGGGRGGWGAEDREIRGRRRRRRRGTGDGEREETETEKEVERAGGGERGGRERNLNLNLNLLLFYNVYKLGRMSFFHLAVNTEL